MTQITPQEALQRTIEHREIFHDEMLELMRAIMRGELSPVMTAPSQMKRAKAAGDRKDTTRPVVA